ncbi:hypothetical protein BJ875DRAFT_449286 [Amylocarpus encephaloides]|uniref:Uncharacterized protein n=1 Tax=Amylocarpus encephaloides TaxID=45428 RepID=A0A9P7YSQ5_9HELO|nr:hypothetical protein BJ875DRAFT_449286 [Amylocarpus encephaloides]
MAAESSRYHNVSRQSEDSERDASPLLPSINSTRRVAPSTWEVDIQPVICLRILSTILAIIIFVFWVVDGRGNFVAACIFDMMLIILNIVQLLSWLCTDVMKITVDMRGQSRQISLSNDGKDKIRVSMYLEIFLSLVLLLSIAIGKSTRSRHWSGGLWKAGAIIGFTVVGLQILLALPQLANKRLILTAKLTSLTGKDIVDTKRPETGVAQVALESARRRTIESEEGRPSVEDMV